MIFLLVSVLVVIDVALILFVLKLNRGRVLEADLLKDITEERQLLAELRKCVDQDIKKYSTTNKSTLDKITKIATEAELEVQNGSNTIRQELSSVAEEISGQLEGPLKELANRQVSISKILKDAKNERSRLIKVIQKAEIYSKYFEEEIDYAGLSNQINVKKHNDTMELLAQGVHPKDVSREVGLPLAEIKLIAGIK